MGWPSNICLYHSEKRFCRLHLAYKQVVDWPCSESVKKLLLLHVHTVCTVHVNIVFYVQYFEYLERT